jgi:hypothetical protein
MKPARQDWEKIIVKHIFNEGLVARIRKEYLWFKNKANVPNRNRAIVEVAISPKKPR